MAFSYVPVTDISRHQGAVNFVRMASRGVRAVIIRLGNGTKNDDRAGEYVPAARAAGLAVGGYWFCNPKVDVTGGAQMARMVRRARELGPFDLPLMMDVESYTLEPSGGWPALSGQAYMRWLEDGADVLTTADPHGDRPIVYTNRAYFDGMNMVAGRLADCPLIVARYPFYYQGAPQPPVDASQWDDWIIGATTKRPQVPVGWSDWDGWQFAAGFDRMGAIYGTSSDDLDLNIIKPDAYAAWTQHADHIDSHPDVITPPIVPRPAPVGAITPTLEEPEMPKYIVAESKTRGSALVTTTLDEAGNPHYSMRGFNDPQTAEAWGAAYGSKAYSDADYDALAAGAD